MEKMAHAVSESFGKKLKVRIVKFKVGNFLRCPHVTVCLGVLVCLCGVSELMEEFLDGYEAKFHAAHGVILFGAVTMLKGLTEFAEGLKVVTTRNTEE